MNQETSFTNGYGQQAGNVVKSFFDQGKFEAMKTLSGFETVVSPMTVYG